MIPASGKWLFLFWVNLVAHLIGIIVDHEWTILITKPLIMILLMIWFVSSIRLRFTPFSVLMLVAFLFSLGGDVALMMQDIPAYQMYPMFLLGLGSFLLAQLNYTIAFLSYPSGEKGFLRIRPIMILPFILFWVGINRYLWTDLAAFQLPVLVYSAVITGMALACLNSTTRIHHEASRKLMIGVVLFLCSDTLIALSRFATKIEVPESSFWIMLTYGLAQYFIVHGAIVANYWYPNRVK